MQIRIKNGLDIPMVGTPVMSEPAACGTRRVAVIGSDYGDLWPALAVSNGDRVRAGQQLFADRRHPEILFTAPASGIVREISLGRGGRLTALIIETNDDPPLDWPSFSAASLGDLSAADVRKRLLESGLWVALRARPYERIAQPEVEPRAIFVTAVDTNPLAPDPSFVIQADKEAFSAGVLLLSRLTAGPVRVCVAAGVIVPLPESPNVGSVEFAGPHPAGLPGTHIHALEPRVGDVPDLWHVGYQDVIAIGRLFRQGRVATTKTVAVCGPAATAPGLVRAPLGADLSELVKDQRASSCRVISGSVLAGHQSPGFLGRYHNQVTLLPEAADDRPRFSSFVRTPWRDALGLRARGADRNGPPGGMLPLESFDRVWPFATPPAALLRSLLIGDTEEALDLGCRGLAEEDLALCTYVCAAKSDYGAALRRVLSDAERAS